MNSVDMLSVDPLRVQRLQAIRRLDSGDYQLDFESSDGERLSAIAKLVDAGVDAAAAGA